jgi:type I restriction enzyme S subunit
MTKNNTPQLRFLEFTDEWQEKKLGELFKIGSGRDYKHLKQGNIPVYGTGGLMLHVNDYLYDGKSICIGRKGTIDKPQFLIGKFWTVDTLFYTCDFKNSIPEFIYSIFLKINWQKYNEASGVPSLSKSTIEKIKVIVCSKIEQQKVADFLEKVDERIEGLEKKKELFSKYKKGIMQKIFSQEIRFKDENGKQYPDWEEKKLGDLLDYEQPTRYIVASTEYSNKFKIPVLTAGKSFILGYTEEQNDIFNDLPVIIFDDFTTTSQFVNFPFKVKSSAMKILKAKKNENIKFIFESIQRINFEVGSHGRHWISIFSGLKIKTPCNKEQQKIADFLTLLDNKIDQINNKLTQAKLFKKSLLQKMFA